MQQSKSLVEEATETQEPFECLIKMAEKLMTSEKVKTQKDGGKYFKSLTQDLDELTKKDKINQELYEKTIMNLISECKHAQLLKMNDKLESANQTIQTYSYLRTVNEELIWNFYKPALILAILDAEERGDIDEDTEESLDRLRFNWLNSRMIAVEKFIETGDKPVA